MNFYHFIPTQVLQGFMRGKPIGPIPTLCPTPTLIDHGVLTFYGQYGSPLTLRFFEEHKKKKLLRDVERLKFIFEEKRRKSLTHNQFTLQCLAKVEEREAFMGDPNDVRIFCIPKDWEQIQNRVLTGAAMILVIDNLASVFRNNLMQVIDAKRPHNTELYPDAKSKLEATKNIHVYALLYLRGYQKRLERVLKTSQTINLMTRETLEELRQEQALVVSLGMITDRLKELVGFYEKNQVPADFEKSIIDAVSALPKGDIKYTYL